MQAIVTNIRVYTPIIRELVSDIYTYNIIQFSRPYFIYFWPKIWYETILPYAVTDKPFHSNPAETSSPITVEFELFNVSHLILLSTVIVLSGTYPAYVEKLISRKPSLFVVFTPIKISAYKSLKLVVPL